MVVQRPVDVLLGHLTVVPASRPRLAVDAGHDGQPQPVAGGLHDGFMEADVGSGELRRGGGDPAHLLKRLADRAGTRLAGQRCRAGHLPLQCRAYANQLVQNRQ